MQETNPELVEQLRRQMQADGSGPDPKPGDFFLIQKYIHII